MNDSTDLLATPPPPPMPPRFILALSLLPDAAVAVAVAADGGRTRRPPDLAAPADLKMKIVDSFLIKTL